MSGITVDELNNLFVVRQEHYNDQTALILNILQLVRDCIIEVLTNKGVITNNINFLWEDVALVNQQFLIFECTMEYKPGTVLQDDNDAVITITEENFNMFKVPLRIGLPYKLALYGTKEQIINFLYENDNGNAEETHNTEYQFDLDALSDEQRQSLEMTMKSFENMVPDKKQE